VSADDHLHPAQFDGDPEPPSHLDLYHRTDAKSAAIIHATKKMTSKENTQRAYFSTHEDSDYGKGFGDHVIHVRVPSHMADLDDEFPSGEQHYAVKVNKLRPEHFQ
jgi:hypothetical protein